MKTRTIAAAVAVTAIASIALTGCAAPSADSSTGKTTVTVMTWETSDTNALIDAALASFTSDTIDVKRIDAPSGNYSAQLSSLSQAGKLPDLFWCGNDTEQQFTKLGLLTDWSGQLGKGSSLSTDSFDGSALASFTSDSGAIGGVPSLLNTQGVWYNADAFTAAALKLPAEGWTWDEMYADAAALSNKDGATFGLQLGGATGTDGPFTMSTYAVSAGGKPFIADVNNPVSAEVDKHFTEGVTKLADAIKAGSVAPPGYDGSNATALFSAGQLPMLQSGQWLAAGFLADAPKVKYGFAPLPTVTGGKFAAISDAVGICTPKTTVNPDDTFKVLSFLNSKVWEDILPKAPVAPPAVVGSRDSYFSALSGVPADIGTTVKSTLASPLQTGVRLTTTWASQVNDLTTAFYLPILSGTAPISDLQSYVDKVNAVITQNK